MAARPVETSQARSRSAGSAKPLAQPLDGLAGETAQGAAREVTERQGNAGGRDKSHRSGSDQGMTRASGGPSTRVAHNGSLRQAAIASWNEG